MLILVDWCWLDLARMTLLMTSRTSAPATLLSSNSFKMCHQHRFHGLKVLRFLHSSVRDTGTVLCFRTKVASLCFFVSIICIKTIVQYSAGRFLGNIPIRPGFTIENRSDIFRLEPGKVDRPWCWGCWKSILIMVTELSDVKTHGELIVNFMEFWICMATRCHGMPWPFKKRLMMAAGTIPGSHSHLAFRQIVDQPSFQPPL